jgi:putative transposase
MGAQLVQHHSRVLLLVHVVWATVERRPLLDGDADDWLRGVLARKAREAGCALVACGNSWDHVHALVRYPSTVALAPVMKSLKGYSSYEWNATRGAKRLSWQAGYWAESVSPDGMAALIAYVEEQRQHHLGEAPTEPWELVEGTKSIRQSTKTMGPVRT